MVDSMRLGMAYAYRSTGREKVMSENRELALSIALEAVLNAARELHVDVDELCEQAIGSLTLLPKSVSPSVVAAIREIEVASDALDFGAMEGG
jgi:hypothetical protein